MKQLVRIPLQQVTLSESRPTVPETVNALASSMQAIGLMQPVTLRATGSGYRVVAGNHRVSAARALGWAEIEAFVLQGTATADQELREIDENLIRAALTPAQRAWAIKRRKELWEALHGAPPEEEEASQEAAGTNCPTSLKDGRPAGPQHAQRFASETAERTGQSKKDINRHAARGEALGDILHEIAGTSLDKGVELDALKALPEEERRHLIQSARNGEQVSARLHRRRLAMGGAEEHAPRAEFLCPNCRQGAWRKRTSEAVHGLYRVIHRYCPECGCRGKTTEEVAAIFHIGAEPNRELLPLLTDEARAELQRLTESR